MAGDPYKPAVTGGRVSFNRTWFNDVSRLAERGKFGRSLGDLGALSGPVRQGIVLVGNNSGVDLPRRSILGVDDALILPDPAPDGNLESFLDATALIGSTPDATAASSGNFVVTLDPILKNGVRRAYAFGIVGVMLNLTSTSHQFCSCVAGNRTSLVSGATGTTPIVWAPNVTGLNWAYVMLGGGGAGGTLGSGQYQGDVFQMVAQDQTGWGPVRAHPMR